MAKGFVTAAEVAARAGVSRSAVSRTFTHGAYVSPEMRARVSEAARQAGYRVNRLAQSLIQDRSSLVGLVGAHLETPFNAALLSAISQALPETGFHPLLFNTDHAEGRIEPLIEQALEYRVRALVILSGSPPGAIVAESLRRGLRVILINRPMPGVPAHTILSDDAQGARLAAEAFVRAGARHLAVVASAAGTPAQRRRTRGFCARARALGARVVVWAEGETGYETGERAGMALLGGTDRPQGVFCVTDLLALGLLDAARHRLGLDVPGQVGVIGFDDIPAACWRAYGLTTIRQSPAGLAKAVVTALQDGRAARRRTVVPVELITRGTLAPFQSE